LKELYLGAVLINEELSFLISNLVRKNYAPNLEKVGFHKYLQTREEPLNISSTIYNLPDSDKLQYEILVSFE